MDYKIKGFIKAALLIVLILVNVILVGLIIFAIITDNNAILDKSVACELCCFMVTFPICLCNLDDY